ncbi:hypothetical protein E2C01_003136 [Portunus trituberculatus]|uniref:Uncharacterized protein n=1 Tax=Portunus trituberculatus TaxID=210409 RepID=A0A5B7CLS7_PORTR|nr:hypothetical protein [Portunus trituberculatus]
MTLSPRHNSHVTSTQPLPALRTDTNAAVNVWAQLSTVGGCFDTVQGRFPLLILYGCNANTPHKNITSSMATQLLSRLSACKTVYLSPLSMASEGCYVI